MHAVKLTLPVLLLGASCTALLGVEEGVLDEGSGGAAGTAATSSVSSAASGETTSASQSSAASSSGGGTSSASGTASSGGGGGGGDGSAGGEGGAGAPASTGSGGDGGAGGIGSGGGTTSGGAGEGGGGGSGGAAASSGTGGEGGGCALPALPPCVGVQPNPFSVPADLTDFWDVVAPAASVTASDELQLRIANGTTEARIQAKTSLDEPFACAAWIRLVMPNGGAGMESGIAIVAEGQAYVAYHLEGELRVRDPLGGLAIIAYGAATERVRARFDAAGDLWFDASPDGACWTEVDGPFALDPVTVDVQLYVRRLDAAGNASSTFDDFSR